MTQKQMFSIIPAVLLEEEKSLLLKGLNFRIPTKTVIILITQLILSYFTEIVLILTRSSHPEVFLGKVVLKICTKFTGEHSCRSVISIKLLCNFIEITLRHGCSPVNLLHIFRILFLKNTSGQLLLIDVLSVEDLDFIKIKKPKDIVLHSFFTYHNKKPQHLSTGEIDALQNLSQNKQIIIQKSDRSNCLAIISWQKEAN